MDIIVFGLTVVFFTACFCLIKFFDALSRGNEA